MTTNSDFDYSDLALALSSACVGVWKWHIASGEVTWSDTVYTLFGIDKHSLDGELSFKHWEDKIHEDDLPMVTKAIERALATCEDYKIEHRIDVDGKTRWFRGQGRALMGDDGKPYAMTGTVIDITEEMNTLHELAEASKRFRLYSELASDYIYSADLTGPVITPSIVGGSFERTTGYKADEVDAHGGWVSLFHPEDQKRVPQIMEELSKGHPVVNEYRLRTKDGSYRWLRDRIHPILSPEGTLIALNGGVQDITERKLLLDRLGHAQKMEALAHLAGSVAHDFNNLLTVMYASTGLLKTEAKSKLALEALAALETSTTRAADLTGSLLTFSRRQVAIRHPKRLSDLLDGAMPILSRACDERMSIERIDQSNDVFVAVDSSQIELALLNLVVNAKDAMPNGGVVTITAAEKEWRETDLAKPVELAAGTYAQVSVQDAGTGISNETMAHLFEPFFTTKEAGNGTGLGLAAVHGVVRQHEGAIVVESEPGRGSTFTIYLPATVETVSKPRHESISEVAVGGTERILIVEDDPLVKSVTARNLTELGYDVISAGSAEEALPLVGEVDLVLTDVRLPGMPGTELAERIAERWPGKPVVLMSGLVEDDAQKAVVESGMFPFLPKPFTQAALAKRLRGALETK